MTGSTMTMTRRCLIAGLTLLTFVLTPAGDRAWAQAGASGGPGASLDRMLAPYLAKYGAPAIAAAVVRDGKIVASGAVGTRRAGFNLPVSVNDRFHIGSDTKAMTSLLIAMFVEEGKLRWESRMDELFPELAAGMDADFKAITVKQLLSHTSGLPSDTDEIEAQGNQAELQPGNLDAQRYWWLKQWASRKPEAKPGERWAYSNLGYVFAGVILERLGGKTWEELVATRVFDPLKLRSAGFGPQVSLGRVDAPLGHELKDGKLIAYLAGPNGDNPDILGPAGTVHMSLLDFAAWAGWQAGEGKRAPLLVKPATMRLMHTQVIAMPMQRDAATGTPARGTAVDAGYALGWGLVTQPISPEPFVFHGGSNTKNLAVIMLQPKYDFAMVMMTNLGGPKSDEALHALAKDLCAKFCPAQPAPSR